MLADAVFDVVSERTIAAAVKTTVNASVFCAGSHEVTNSPIAFARPV